ncbi:cutinase family protein [Nocardia panacis]|uniref:cutinase family protein n=1 Tax=Nocardia panacis TaxID=2340916 RepID=UPI00131585D3|nr:cutinase family protein [Nocardia panacis]
MVIATAILAGPLISVAGEPAARAGAGGCPLVAGIFLAGTGETHPGADAAVPVGLLGPVGAQLSQRFGDRFVARFPAYSASAFDRLPYGDSKATGVAAVRDELVGFGKRCPATKFVLAGYSQGADVLGDVAVSIGCAGDPVPADQVLGVGLVADPRRGTAGGKLVGPQVSGQGIAGPRPGGFCGLSSVTAEICAGEDRYCATDAGQHPILAGLGRMLSQPTGPQIGSNDDKAAQELTRSLGSDFSGVNLADASGAVQRMIAEVSSGHPDIGHLTQGVKELTSTLGPLADLSGWAAENPGAKSRLSQASPGSGDKLAANVLDAASRSDLSSALDALASIASQITGAAATGADRSTLSGAVDRVASATAPLTDSMAASPAAALSQASRVLSVLKPSVVVDQVLNVVVNGLRFAANVPGVLDVLGRVVGLVGDPAIDIPGKVRGLHDLFGTLNSEFAPLVKMVAGVDLRMISHLIGLIPDTTGTAQIISLLVGMLANLDVGALAAQIGQLQDNLWQVAEALAAGANPIDVGVRLAELVPTLLGFAGIAVNTLVGSSDHGADVQGLARSATDLAGKNGADALGQLVSEGFSAASFFASGVHQGYDHYVVDGDGRTAIQWLVDWFSNRIRSVVPT